MDPSSTFLKTIHSEPLSQGTHYDLIYGGNGVEDGVVTTVSTLQKDNLKYASSITHFPYDHMAILSQPVTVTRVLECLQNDLSKYPQITNGPPGATNIIYQK